MLAPRKLVQDTSNMIEIETIAPPSHMYNSPPGKRKRSEDDEEEKSVSSDHRVPTMVERREEVNSLLGTHLPFSSMMRRMAAKYQKPSVSPTPSHLNLPLLSSPLHISSHPYSRLIATLASSYSSPPPTPQPQTTCQPQPKRMREESPIDLSPTADSEDLLDVVSVDDQEEEKKVRQEQEEQEEQERRERAQKLQRLLAAAMFNRAGT